MASEERLRELEEKYEGYTVYDNQGSKIGKVDDLFVDEKDNEEYIGVKMGLFGTKSTLIPTEVVRVNENDRTIEVSETKDHVKDAPNFSDDDDITAEYEERIRRHFGLESLQTGSDRGSYASGAGGAAGSATAGSAAGAATGSGTSDRDENRDEDHETSGYAPGDQSADQDAGRETSTGETREGAHDGDHGTSGETYADDRETSSSGGTFDNNRESSSGTAAGGSGYTGGREGYEDAGSSGSQTSGSQTSGSQTSGSQTSGSQTSGSQPSTSRQTEETETFQEGGRTKIRRRVIREEVVDADDQNS